MYLNLDWWMRLIVTAARRLLICAGGTGGHIHPAVSVIEKLKENKDRIEIAFIGSSRDEGLKAVKDIEAGKYFLKVIPFERRFSLSWFPSLYWLIRAFINMMEYLRKYKPQSILGFGGFVSAPVMLASLVLRVPFMIHEQNLIPGRTNKIFARFATVFFASFPETKDYLSKRTAFIYTGNPIKYSNRISKEEARASFNLSVEHITIGFFGGSRGSALINELVFDHLSRILLNKGVQILHITGYDEKRSFKSDGYLSMSYIENMQNFYCACDLIVCRAGASTIAELKYFRKPAVLIPYPYAVSDHQQKNAEHLAKAGCAVILNNSKIQDDKEKYADLIAKLVLNKKDIERMEFSYSFFGKGIDSALKMVEEILSN